MLSLQTFAGDIAQPGPCRALRIIDRKNLIKLAQAPAGRFSCGSISDLFLPPSPSSTAGYACSVPHTIIAPACTSLPPAAFCSSP